MVQELKLNGFNYTQAKKGKLESVLIKHQICLEKLKNKQKLFQLTGLEINPIDLLFSNNQSSSEKLVDILRSRKYSNLTQFFKNTKGEASDNTAKKRKRVQFPRLIISHINGEPVNQEKKITSDNESSQNKKIKH